MPEQPLSIDPNREAYPGLTRLTPTLAARAYFADDAFARDLETIWHRNWIYVCRSGEIGAPLSFRTVRVGTQEILIVRDDKGGLNAFHNTCRHRGSALRREESGRLKSRLIACPYHSWSYSLSGELVRVPSATCPQGFNKADYPLYRVRVAEWRGFVFVNIDHQSTRSIEETFDPQSGDLARWPLETLATGHVLRKTIACNWKIFWENFNECLHCPNVHPELSDLVPIYRRGFMARRDDPDWKLHADNDAPEYSGGLKAGAATWSSNGRSSGFEFAGLTEAERAAGQTYATHLPSVFIVGHADHVRVVSLRPLGPETTELTAEWLFPEEALAADGFDLDNIVAFGTLILKQDANICEVNQRGLRSIRHEAGVLMPEEYDLARFHDWVKSQHSAHGKRRA